MIHRGCQHNAQCKLLASLPVKRRVARTRASGASPCVVAVDVGRAVELGRTGRVDRPRGAPRVVLRPPEPVVLEPAQRPRFHKRKVPVRISNTIRSPKRAIIRLAHPPIAQGIPLGEDTSRFGQVCGLLRVAKRVVGRCSVGCLTQCIRRTAKQVAKW